MWWDGLDRAMAGYPKSYRVWLTKHVSEFCGNNVQLYYWSRGTQSPKCEFCKTEDEYYESGNSWQWEFLEVCWKFPGKIPDFACFVA